MYIHADKRRKKRSGPTIKPEYRLELKSVNANELASVVENEMGPLLQDAGVEMVVVDNDRKAHSKATRVAFQKFGIKIWPGAGVVGDRKLIPEFTGKGIEDQGGFPVNSPDCMVLDQSVNNTWKTMRATCIPHFGSESPQGKQMRASSMT